MLLSSGRRPRLADLYSEVEQVRGDSFRADWRLTDLIRHVAATSTKHKRTRPYTPRTNGKVERFKCATRRSVVSPAQPGGNRGGGSWA
jgi:hypothetical protein